MIEVCVRHVFHAGAEKVFAGISDHRAFLGTSQIKCRLLRPGDDSENGQGAVREVRSGQLCFEEVITAFDAPLAYEYRIRSLRGPLGIRLPFQHQHGRLEIEQLGSATRVIWRSRFHFSVPILGGWIERKIAASLETTFSIFLARLDTRLAESASCR